MIPLKYQLNMKRFYQELSQLEGFALLESDAQSSGRYDILTALPFDRIVVPADSSIAMSDIKGISLSLKKETSVCHLPFQGGAVGYVAYDFGARLYGIETMPQPELGDLPLLDLGLYDWAIIVDHLLKEVFLFAAHRHHHTKHIVQRVLDRWFDNEKERGDYSLSSDLNCMVSKKQYETAFQVIHGHLQSGRCYQVNYTQPFYYLYQGDAWEIYQQIQATNPVPFSAFINTSSADILCFSPERFILHEAGELLSSPIKGTIKRSSNPKEDEALKTMLFNSEKNKAENVMIVDLMRNDFSKIAQIGSVRVDNLCAIQSFKSVHHLVSDVHATCLPHLAPFEAFMSCFPGGSITGAPKLEAMKVIHEQEKWARGVYCGSIGYFSSHGRFDTNIAIRTVVAKANRLHFAAGGGIVIDSDCEDEYRECFTKIAAIVNGIESTE